MYYTKEFLKALDGTVVALKYVESIQIMSDDDLKIVEKLKEDLYINITMISGNTYKISVKDQYGNNDVRLKTEGLDDARSAIFHKWCHITAKEKQ